jgi:DedD protein
VDGLKQRIIGALVLISLAVIFVPMVFDEPHSERTSTDIRIPEEPPFPEVATPDSEAVRAPARQSTGMASDTGMEPEADNTSDEAPGYRIVEEGDSPADSSADTPRDVAQPAPQKQNNVPAQQPATASEGNASTGSGTKSASSAQPDSTEYASSLKGAWVVQLGSFGNADNARRLRNEVRKQGYSSSLQEVVRADTTLTRVFSGPFASKSDAEAAKQALDKAFNLNSLVTTGDK